MEEGLVEGVEFTLNRDRKGVSGFTLKGVGKTEAEAYCFSFLTAQATGKTDIDFKDGKIVFTHPGVSPDKADPRLDVWGSSPGGVFEADIAAEDATALSDLLRSSGAYAGTRVRVRLERAWGKGFTVYLERK